MNSFLTSCDPILPFATLSLPAEQKLELLNTPVRGGALDLYYEHVQGKVSSIEDAVKILTQRYERPERQS